ncbi:uncharacterized protein BDV17DRAFT_257370 [Aspergillus undulatus]|uniref:uncharacterized protein n=1 Tax=Aspergillus undulatus TaxID=1810928 RepID=UPI003CCCE800
MAVNAVLLFLAESIWQAGTDSYRPINVIRTVLLAEGRDHCDTSERDQTGRPLITKGEKEDSAPPLEAVGNTENTSLQGAPGIVCSTISSSREIMFKRERRIPIPEGQTIILLAQLKNVLTREQQILAETESRYVPCTLKAANSVLQPSKQDICRSVYARCAESTPVASTSWLCLS